MEPEDYNGAVLTYNPSTLTAGDVTTSSNTLVWNPPTTESVETMRYNSDLNLQIPLVFEKVLKKTIDGLVSVRIIGYERVSIVNPVAWQSEFHFLNYIELTFKYKSDAHLTEENYSDKINFAFEMTYPDIKSYKFRVKNIVAENPDSHKEFLEFFSR